MLSVMRQVFLWPHFSHDCGLIRIFLTPANYLDKIKNMACLHACLAFVPGLMAICYHTVVGSSKQKMVPETFLPPTILL
jgi:hypothetical protein